MNFSIIIPAYNEEKRLPKTLIQVADFLRENYPNSEIIISDDGSTDGTVAYVRTFKSKIPVRIVQGPKRSGKGAAVKIGMLAAQGDWVLFMDADSSTTINQLKKLVPFTGEAEVLIGSRYAGTEVKIKQSFLRRIVSRVGNLVIRLLTSLNINDTQCGFKMFSKEASKRIFTLLETKGWGFDVEVLMLARKLGYKIKEIPVVWRNSAGSHLRGVDDLVETFEEVLKIRKRVRSLKLN
jgi:dolichyl-phosphate beta-glucosyltransferase